MSQAPSRGKVGLGGHCSPSPFSAPPLGPPAARWGGSEKNLVGEKQAGKAPPAAAAPGKHTWPAPITGEPLCLHPGDARACRSMPRLPRRCGLPSALSCCCTFHSSNGHLGIVGGPLHYTPLITLRGSVPQPLQCQPVEGRVQPRDCTAGWCF